MRSRPRGRALPAPYGQVRSCWERSAGTFVLRTTVPWNTTATVFVPARPPATR
ncbi:alpha-L-rhamnosidase C-terminal domain-containing protein [Streptomyces sp. NPDC001633]|uniref:alpha-L-rhamnosidase C-terminal domain-containing protein n=1 Tax=Streptomyces sp. NPDC001633 TaxID=3364595 RepID=UPI0036BBD6E6